MGTESVNAWENEPDHVAFEYRGYPCIIHRNTMGALCGYAGVGENHPFFERGYEGLDEEIQVHGGLTYAEKCQGDICHPGTEPRWWFGFDCAHFNDLIPNIGRAGMFKPFFPHTSSSREYRDINFVTREIERLVDQLEAVVAQ